MLGSWSLQLCAHAACSCGCRRPHQDVAHGTLPSSALPLLCAQVRPPNVAKYPRTAWRIAEGVATCRARYVPDEVSGKLAGVAVTNHTLPRKFEELCAGILKYEGEA